MGFDEQDGARTVARPKISEREIAEDSGRGDHRKEKRPADFERARAEDRDLHGHRNRRDCGNKDSQQAVTFKPAPQAGAVAFGCMFGQQLFAARTGDPEENRAARDRAQDGAERGPVCFGVVDAGKRDQEQIHAADQRHSDGIESGKEQQAKRAP